MKVTKDDIRKIKIGTSVTFPVAHPRDIDTVRTLASQVNATEPELKTRFSCSASYAKRQVTITATKV